MIFWGCLVFSRENRRPKTAKFKIYLSFEGCGGFRCGSLWGGGGVHWWQVVQGFRLPFVCVPSLSPCLLSLFCFCLWWVACKYAFISHFKGVFSGFWGADVYLYGLGALRGLWGFCVREWLGGFGACGVFALLFVLLSFRFPLLSSCPAFAYSPA